MYLALTKFSTCMCFIDQVYLLYIIIYLMFTVQALVELEANTEIRPTLREVFFTGAKEIDAAGKKAICVSVPVPQQKTFQKVQVGCLVIIIKVVVGTSNVHAWSHLCNLLFVGDIPSQLICVFAYSYGH